MDLGGYADNRRQGSWKDYAGKPAVQSREAAPTTDSSVKDWIQAYKPESRCRTCLRYPELLPKIVEFLENQGDVPLQAFYDCLLVAEGGYRYSYDALRKHIRQCVRGRRGRA